MLLLCRNQRRGDRRISPDPTLLLLIPTHYVCFSQMSLAKVSCHGYCGEWVKIGLQFCRATEVAFDNPCVGPRIFNRCVWRRVFVRIVWCFARGLSRPSEGSPRTGRLSQNNLL